MKKIETTFPAHLEFRVSIFKKGPLAEELLGEDGALAVNLENPDFDTRSQGHLDLVEINKGVVLQAFQLSRFYASLQFNIGLLEFPSMIDHTDTDLRLGERKSGVER